jgi:DNA-binding beta-propeller fold protein YncE
VISRIHRWSASCAAVALLTGCGGAQSVTQSLTGAPLAASPFMKPDAKKQTLVYVSSVLTNDVYVYSLATQQLEGTLTGFSTPYGLCSDKSGDVWIANDGASQLVEYAHGGTKPIATLADSGYYPEGCAVDPTTGNLAVTNFSSTTGNGDVAIYAGAQGSPQTYSDPQIVNYRFCGYDSKGNLFVDGANSSSAFALAELPKGSSSLTNITLAQKIEWPGGVQWDGKYVAVGDTDAATIYRITSNGTVKGSIKLDGANYVNQFWIDGSIGKKKKKAGVIVPSQDGGSVGFYDYPAGGSTVWSIGISEPFGATVST